MKSELERKIVEIAKKVPINKCDTCEDIEAEYKEYPNPQAAHWFDHLIGDLGNSGVLDETNVVGVMQIITECEELPPIAEEGCRSYVEFYKAAIKRNALGVANHR